VSVDDLERPIQELSQIFATVPVGFCVFDAGLRYRYINPVLAALNGLPAEAHLGRNVLEVLPEAAHRIEPALRQVLATGRTVAGDTEVSEIPGEPGTAKSFRNIYSPICNEHGEVVGASCLVTDVTEQRRAETKLQTHLETLEAQVAARTADLKSINRRLETEILVRQRAEFAQRESQTQLIDAIESMSQGFVLYDSGDRILTCNQRIREMLPDLAGLLVPGTHYSDLIRANIQHWQYDLTASEVATVVDEWIGYHHNLSTAWEIPTVGDRRLRVTGSRTNGGGIAEIITDVTESRLAELALRHSEQRFQDFAASSSDWFWEMDADLRFTYMSPNVVLAMGMPATFYQGNTAKELLGADADSEVWRGHLAGFERHEPFRDFVYMRQGEGVEDRWFSSSGIPIFDEDGEFAGYRGVGSDVSKRMRAEEALRVSERRFREFADNASDWFWEMDENLRFTQISSSVEKIIGLPVEHHLGKTRLEIGFSDTDTPEWQEHLAKLERHEPYNDFLQRRITPLGERWILSNGVPVFDDDGQFTGYFGTGKDITVLRQAEQTNQRFLEAIDKLAEGVALFDAEDRFVVCNAQYRRLSADRADYLVAGKTFEDTLREIIANGDLPAADDDPEAWLEERMARRRGTGGTFELRRGTFDLLISENKSPDGGMVMTLRDMTELKKSESQLRQAQKMEAIGQLTGGIAHDFNNLLAVMMGNLSLLDDDLGEDHEHTGLTGSIMHAVDQAAELTNRMLAFARLQPLSVGLVDANELLRDMQPILRRSLAEEIVVEFALAQDLASCIADSGQLEQAILNLAINGRDAMSEGGRLCFETRNVILTDDPSGDQEGFRPGPYVLIMVTDHGHGISAADQLRIFDPFFTTKEPGKGTGLGLSMVYGFTKQSNGNITVESEPGAGTTFKVYLPAGTATGQDDEADTAGDCNLPQGNAVILLVEDEEQVCVMVARALRKQGYQVLVAENALAGLELLAANPDIDLLLTDIMLPGGLNGRQLADVAIAERPSLNVLFMSGYAKDDIVRQGRLNPDVRLLTKPFTPATLAQYVSEALDET
jgi:PAS domain S-box-containing protein